MHHGKVRTNRKVFDGERPVVVIVILINQLTQGRYCYTIRTLDYWQFRFFLIEKSCAVDPPFIFLASCCWFDYSEYLQLSQQILSLIVNFFNKNWRWSNYIKIYITLVTNKKNGRWLSICLVVDTKHIDKESVLEILQKNVIQGKCI